MSHEKIGPVLRVSMSSHDFSALSCILQKGFVVDATVESTLTEFLCSQLGLDREYVDTRIATIFLDGKPVDSIDAAIVKDGTIVALSAALPGLAGATYRRGSRYAAFRKNVSYRKERGVLERRTGKVVLKLFNTLIADLAPKILERGIWIGREDVAKLLAMSGKKPDAPVIQNQKDIVAFLQHGEDQSDMLRLQARIV